MREAAAKVGRADKPSYYTYPHKLLPRMLSWQGLRIVQLALVNSLQRSEQSPLETAMAVVGPNGPPLPKPALLYVFTSPSRPGQCKIGKAQREDLRMKAAKTWIPIEVYATFAFVHSYLNETKVHHHFASRAANEAEWFNVGPGEACDYLRRLVAVQAPLLDEFKAMVALASEIGIFDISETSAPNSALQAILSWKLPRRQVVAGPAIRAALQSLPGCTQFVPALTDAGLLVDIAQAWVLLDLSEGTPLVRHLDKTIGKGRWERLLKDVGALTKEGQPVTIGECIRECLSDPLTLEKSFSAQSRRVSPS
jgi:hypothetical protein